ncbi:MAG: transcription/translation regulatory transformer protein RfaH [Kangiellaceae bacterium]|nr:transcription/translation regulatory transformer protein RfaH [Kangiellaceae bacterium]
MSIEQGMQWYLVHCKAKQELRAQEHLANQGVESYLPTIELEKIIRGKRKQLTEALFPNYIFIRLNTNGQGWSTIRSTRGVRDFVKFAGVPAKVPAQLLQTLQLMDKGAVKVKSNAPKSGEKVQIIEGPFKDLEGVYKNSSGEMRSIVLLNVLGKITELELANSAVIKLEK